MSDAKPMDYVTRIQHYREQNGTARLTPAQDRRARKKLNCTTRKADLLMELLTFSDEPVREPKIRPCGGVEFCITKSGGKAKKTHVKCREYDQ